MTLLIERRVRTRKIRGNEPVAVPRSGASIREICLMGCDPGVEGPRAGDTVQAAGRTYRVVRTQQVGREAMEGIDLPEEQHGYVHVCELPSV